MAYELKSTYVQEEELMKKPLPDLCQSDPLYSHIQWPARNTHTEDKEMNPLSIGSGCYDGSQVWKEYNLESSSKRGRNTHPLDGNLCMAALEDRVITENFSENKCQHL